MNTTKKKNPHAVALGILGGKKGGIARAQNMKPDERREIARRASAARMEKMNPDERSAVARKAAQARWNKQRGQLT